MKNLDLIQIRYTHIKAEKNPKKWFKCILSTIVTEFYTIFQVSEKTVFSSFSSRILRSMYKRNMIWWIMGIYHSNTSYFMENRVKMVSMIPEWYPPNGWPEAISDPCELNAMKKITLKSCGGVFNNFTCTNCIELIIRVRLPYRHTGLPPSSNLGQPQNLFQKVFQTI